MCSRFKRFIVLVLAVALVTVPLSTGVLAQSMLDENPEPSGEEMAADFVLSRPLGLVSIAVGSVVWFLSSPFSIIAGNSEQAFQKLVMVPARYTFERPLGELP